MPTSASKKYYHANPAKVKMGISGRCVGYHLGVPAHRAPASRLG